jgi:hypothetical protein
MTSLDAGLAKLAQAMRKLSERWEVVEEHWKDSVRVTFEEKQLRPIEEQARATLNAMQRIQEVLRKAESECR